MAQLVKLLDHQARFVQAPYIFEDIRFFILCGGFACGKTSSLVYAVLYAVKLLLGKKDKEGNNPRIMVCSKTITFLSKTWTTKFEQVLKATGSSYKYDKAHNIITVGSVEIYLIATEEPENIYGFDVCYCVVDELDELPTGTAMEAVKSINDRVRQQIEGFRSPTLCFATTSQGLKGLYQTVLHFKKSGIGYVLMRARTCDNTYLPKDYVKNMYTIYNEKERECLLEGKFISIDSGLVFPDYNPEKNLLDYDLYETVRDEMTDATVYIGQDFNCIQGDVPVETLKGKVKIKNIKAGDYVLTRKGYKKVLRNVCKGVKMVQDFNNGLLGTSDHIAITPDGEIELCKAKRFYSLTEQNTEFLKEERKALTLLLQLKKSLLMEENTTETQTDAYNVQATSMLEKELSTETYTKNILELYRAEIISIIKTESMTTDLKILLKYPIQSTQKSISLNKLVYTLKLQEKDLENIIYHLKAESNTVKFLKQLGKKENILAQLLVWIAAGSLKQKLEQPNGAQTAKNNGIFIEREKLIKVLKELALFAESILQEQVQQNIARNTKVIGKDLIGKERLSKVYDIEVEDTHEFYANGILVHNCFGNNAVAAVIIDKAVVLIKDYEFPDIRKAPQVFRYDFPTQRIVWIPDMTYKEHFGEFKKELKMHKINIAYRSCNPLVTDRNFAANKLFFTERLFVCPLCKDTENTLLTWQKDPKTGLPSKGGKGAPDHKGDCLGYIVHYLLSWRRELKDIYSVTLGRLYTKRREHGASAAELEASTSILKPEQIKPTLKLPDETPEA